MTNFTHINKQGNAKMVDVSNKENKTCSRSTLKYNS